MFISIKSADRVRFQMCMGKRKHDGEFFWKNRDSFGTGSGSGLINDVLVGGDDRSAGTVARGYGFLTEIAVIRLFLRVADVFDRGKRDSLGFAIARGN